ncbi:hypothetical protein BKA65DRAFT_414321, partial [Rhexocercosporidium sp. MPI-PUGE-AT-0058]
NLPFEENFFALPTEYRERIIAFLSVPDILRLRRVSKRWYEFISIHETPISRIFLTNNPLPSFADSLYKLPIHPSPSQLNLNYICGIWYRLAVTSTLSKLMIEWIAEDLFLLKEYDQQLEFLPHKARMERRLTPLLFTIFHFFETYRQLHLKHLLENDHQLLPEGCTINAVERQIMKMYDDDTLLQVHQIFPLLVRYLDFTLRPPSFYGRMERSFRGYVRNPPPENVLLGIFCIGGLGGVVRFCEIESYDARIASIDDWYKDVSRQRAGFGFQPRRWQVQLRRKRPKQTFSIVGRTVGSTTSAFESLQDINAPGDNHDDSSGTRLDQTSADDSNFVSRRPMPSLSAEDAQLLIPDLPHLSQIWLPTATFLLVEERKVVERPQDIKKNAQILMELIHAEFTTADKLFYGRDKSDMTDNISLGWGDLLDDPSRRVSEGRPC